MWMDSIYTIVIQWTSASAGWDLSR
jgi:hypothetical protein